MENLMTITGHHHVNTWFCSEYYTDNGFAIVINCVEPSQTPDGIPGFEMSIYSHYGEEVEEIEDYRFFGCDLVRPELYGDKYYDDYDDMDWNRPDWEDVDNHKMYRLIADYLKDMIKNPEYITLH